MTRPGLSETYTYDTDTAAAVLDCAIGSALRWGRTRQTELSGYDSPNPYPAAGYSVTLSLPSDMESHLLIYSSLASCDTLEVRRTGTGEVLWSWPYDSGFFRSAWTPALSGDVDVGIWSTQGCNQTDLKEGFSVRRLYTRLPPGAPANLHIPGQRALSASAASRRGALNEPEADLLENWHRIYQPAQAPEQLQMHDHVRRERLEGS